MAITESQRQWASDRVGEDRAVPFTGEITAVPRITKKEATLKVTASDGRTAETIMARPASMTEDDEAWESFVRGHVGDTATVLIEGTVTDYIEQDNNVVLVVSGDAGQGTEAVVPPRSAEDEAALLQEFERAAEEGRVEFERAQTARETEDIQRFLDAVEDRVREIVREMVAPESLREP